MDNQKLSERLSALAEKATPQLTKGLSEMEFERN
jgi:hypothetical protein